VDREANSVGNLRRFIDVVNARGLPPPPQQGGAPLARPVTRFTQACALCVRACAIHRTVAAGVHCCAVYTCWRQGGAQRSRHPVSASSVRAGRPQGDSAAGPSRPSGSSGATAGARAPRQQPHYVLQRLPLMRVKPPWTSRIRLLRRHTGLWGALVATLPRMCPSAETGSGFGSASASAGM